LKLVGHPEGFERGGGKGKIAVLSSGSKQLAPFMKYYFGRAESLEGFLKFQNRWFDLGFSGLFLL